MLPDIKKLQASKKAKILTAFLIFRKKKQSYSNHVNTYRLTNNFHFKYRHRKKLKLGKQNVKTDEWLGNLCKALKTKH